jgi:hypothetical protein
MAAMSMKITSNYRQMNKELDRLEDAPNRAKLYLDSVLSRGFNLTQGAVHVITASLKTSGVKDSKMRKDVWIGTIRYGGKSLGVNNPVNYAIYELERDGDHDFMKPLDTLGPLYVKAILKALK